MVRGVSSFFFGEQNERGEVWERGEIGEELRKLTRV